MAEWTELLEHAGFRLGETSSWRLHMDFATWTARIRTPPASAAAIRTLEAGASEATRRHLVIEADGSFLLDVAWFGVTAD